MMNIEKLKEILGFKKDINNQMSNSGNEVNDTLDWLKFECDIKIKIKLKDDISFNRYYITDNYENIKFLVNGVPRCVQKWWKSKKTIDCEYILATFYFKDELVSKYSIQETYLIEIIEKNRLGRIWKDEEIE